MKNLVLACLAGWLGLGLASQAHAQGYTPPSTSPFYRPPVSPYLNLLRPGTSPGVNYYGLVRPQFDTYNTLNQLQSQQSQLQNNLNYDQSTGALNTGHAVRFGNYSHYFNNFGSSGGGYTAVNRGVLGTGPAGMPPTQVLPARAGVNAPPRGGPVTPIR